MKMENIPSGITTWSEIEKTEHQGELHTELSDGRKITLNPGTSYQVADNTEPHRSFTGTGAILFIID
jgi:hypothetical protein